MRLATAKNILPASQRRTAFRPRPVLTAELQRHEISENHFGFFGQASEFPEPEPIHQHPQ